MSEEPLLHKVPAAICLTEGKPIQCKDVVWAKQTTADLLPNYTDLRFPYKRSSMLCPFCLKALTGKIVEKEQPKEEETDSESETGRKKRTPKKPKPWEIPVSELEHEKPEDMETCPSKRILTLPHGAVILQIAIAHQTTWITAMKEKSSLPETRDREQLLQATLDKSPTLPKLITSVDEDAEGKPSADSLF